jgi:hypothetical protein
MNNTNKKITGFTETLEKITNNQNMNANVCLPIYMNGMNSNNINFLQSEFPNLTKIKPFVSLNQNQNQNSVKVEKKSEKKVKEKSKNKVKDKSKNKVRFASPNKIRSNTNTKKKFSFAMPKTKSKIKTKKVNFAI